MKVGDVVKAMRAHDLIVRLGIIVRNLDSGPFGMDKFEVMVCDGRLETYTSAALREVVYDCG